MTKNLNGWGGARRGAGRPRLTPKVLTSETLKTSEPLEWLRALMNLPEAGTRLRLEAAKVLLAYEVKKPS